MASLHAGSSAPAIALKPRLAFIDNLRWLMIIFVVTLHAGVTYSNLGSWYYTEPPQPGGITLFLFATYQGWLQAFFMGFLFFIAGYFVPGALERKGRGRFIRDRMVRLGAPSLLYVFVIHPVLVFWILGWYWTRPVVSFWRSYAEYLTGLRFLGGTGPMWFAVALLIFACIAAALPIRSARKTGSLPKDRDALLLALAMAACTFLVRLVQPIGTSIYNMQLCFFSQYILLFGLGIVAYRREWLLRIPYGFGMRWFRIALFGGGVAWVLLIGAGGGSGNLQAYTGGWTWQSAAACLWEAFACVGICLGLIVLFRERFNSQGRLAKLLSDNAFAVYVFHAPILVSVSVMLRPWHAHPLAKFAIAGALAVILSFAASELVFRRVPGLRRIL